MVIISLNDREALILDTMAFIGRHLGASVICDHLQSVVAHGFMRGKLFLIGSVVGSSGN